MSTFLTILLCKILIFFLRLIGRGSSLPGKICLKLNPNILKHLTLPKKVICVTGSNGKTSTSEMIATVLSKSGRKVISNRKGSNQTEGVATLLLGNSTLKGKVKADAAVIETDERYAEAIFENITPSALVITNICRDQMTRNGEPFFVRDKLKAAVDKLPNKTKILVNGDDPISMSLVFGRHNTVYFGADKTVLSSEKSDALYEDVVFCPICSAPVKYSAYHYSHIGEFLCTKCDLRTADKKYNIVFADKDKKQIIINDTPLSVSFTGKYQAYNLCAAFAVGRELGIAKSVLVDTLSDFSSDNGRRISFDADGKNTTLLICKHENSTAYNLNLEYAASQKNDISVMIVIDRISRKYYTAETSWLWDISFEPLSSDNIKNVYLSGKYAYDLAVRLKSTGVDKDKIHTIPDINEAANTAKTDSSEGLIILTCFADAENTLKAFGKKRHI